VSVIITTDVERAAKRLDKTLVVDRDDSIGDAARALADRLGVRIVVEGERPSEPESSAVPQQPPEPAPEPPPAPEPAPIPLLTAESQPSASPVGERASPPAVEPLAPVTAPSVTQPPAPPIVPLSAVPPIAPAEAPPTPPAAPVASVPRIAPIEIRPAEPFGPSVPATSVGGSERGAVAEPVSGVSRLAPEPETLPDLPPIAGPTVTRIPISPTTKPAAPAPVPTLAGRAPPTPRQRRAVSRAVAASPQLGIVLGRVIGTDAVRAAAAQGLRLVRVGPESYVTRSARHLAGELGVVLYPDPSLAAVDDRTHAGAVVNPISAEPAITRQGAGIVRPGGTPVGGDHLAGTLSVQPDEE
jgi:hypothetical protein